MQQIFRVRLPDGTETYVNDRLLDSMERMREEARKKDEARRCKSKSRAKK